MRSLGGLRRFQALAARSAFLQSSRAIRIASLFEGLGLEAIHFDPEEGEAVSEHFMSGKFFLKFLLSLLEQSHLNTTLMEFLLHQGNRSRNSNALRAAMLTLDFTTVSGGSTGKSPALKLGDLVLQESDAITQYLLEKYDTLNYLLPKSRNRRAQV